MSLLDKTKNKLRILDNDSDDLLNQIIENAKINLETLTGTELDFDKSGLAQLLLLEFVRYDYNNATEYFEENFSKELRRLIILEGAKRYAENQRKTT